jgi:hypothetical protein
VNLTTNVFDHCTERSEAPKLLLGLRRQLSLGKAKMPISGRDGRQLCRGKIKGGSRFATTAFVGAKVSGAFGVSIGNIYGGKR